MLKPCKCGEPAEIRGYGESMCIYDEHGYGGGMHWLSFDGYKVECSDCFEETDFFPTIKDAMEAWNNKWN